MFTGLSRKIFGNQNDRIIKGFKKTVEQINALETGIQALTDIELRAQTDKFKKSSRPAARLRTSCRKLLPPSVKRRGAPSASGLLMCS